MSLNINREVEAARYAGSLSLLGCGAYAAVYSNGTDKALKVGDINDAYLDYVEYCLQNQGRNYIPNIHAFVRDQWNSYAVVLDKYSHTLRYENTNFSVDMGNPYSRFEAMRKYEPELHELVCELKELYPNHFFDLHRNNFMISYDQKLYLIDPFTGHPTSSSTETYNADHNMIQNYIQKIC